MSEVAIRVENLSKQYRIGAEQDDFKTLRSVLAGTFSTTAQKISKLISRQTAETSSLEKHIWALRDVSFEVKHGDVVGLIGGNGAGKSTLLKILSRITEPSAGEAAIYGRIGSLLEVGTGFHLELTGRENIYLNGAILGMRKSDIQRQFDEIVDFSEVGEFLDTPVKHYSSGMYLRLAFAVAAHLEPDILLVDEVLAVGDAEFQKKCLNKMQDVSRAGRTVLFVSHNIGAITTLCNKAILLDKGHVTTHGAVNDVVAAYLSAKSVEGAKALIEPPPVSEGIVVQSAEISDRQHNPSAEIDYRFPFNLNVEFEVVVPVATLWLRMRLNNIHGISVIGAWLAFGKRYKCGRYNASCQLPGELLAPGKYSLDVEALQYGTKPYHCVESCLSFTVKNTSSQFDPNDKGWGVIFPQLPCNVEQL